MGFLLDPKTAFAFIRLEKSKDFIRPERYIVTDDSGSWVAEARESARTKVERRLDLNVLRFHYELGLVAEIEFSFEEFFVLRLGLKVVAKNVAVLELGADGSLLELFFLLLMVAVRDFL